MNFQDSAQTFFVHSDQFCFEFSKIGSNYIYASKLSDFGGAREQPVFWNRIRYNKLQRQCCTDGSVQKECDSYSPEQKPDQKFTETNVNSSDTPGYSPYGN